MNARQQAVLKASTVGDIINNPILTDFIGTELEFMETKTMNPYMPVDKQDQADVPPLDNEVFIENELMESELMHANEK